MQTPRRKPGRYSGLKPDPYLTEDKYQELSAKLERLKKHSQPKAIEEVKRLAEMGDFSENAAYQIAKGRLRGINQAIIDIAEHLKQAIIIKPQKSPTVRIGSTVTVSVGGREKTYTILGSSETDPIRGVISHNSPLGAGLIGCRVGETEKIRLNDREVEYRIISID
jgi:transcription elongation factor GreA